jgi:glutamate formiminotransferase / formiminotetrahydrofolate cyclodeaminase
VRRIVECVPNFSEGRRRDVVDRLAAAMTSAQGVALLDSEMDAAHNRCVITVAGEPESVATGVEAAVGIALQLIDLREHRGEHPRMGAADVIPFIPISGIGMEECVALSAKVAENLARRYGLPTYLYEQSARVPERQDLAYIRKGGFETIRDEIGRVPSRKPDFGPAEVHPSGGATAVGARFPLIAYNVYLGTADLKIAQAVARSVRFSTGGLRYVKALGFEIKERGQVQVSMNLTNYEATPVFRAFEMVAREAQRYGVAVVSSEIVGLVPQKALDACADYYLRLEGFSAGQVLENRLSESLSKTATGMTDFVARVASPDPAPGGGSVAAMAGALAAALGEMVSGLTEGRKKYEAVQDRVREVHGALLEARQQLEELVLQDAEAYGGVMAALKLPKDTPEQKKARDEAFEAATRRATEVPLRTVRLAAAVIGHLETLVEIGNANARSDAAAGAQMAFAALKAGQYNVLINVGGLKDRTFAESSRAEAARLATGVKDTLARVDAAMEKAADS